MGVQIIAHPEWVLVDLACFLDGGLYLCGGRLVLFRHFQPMGDLGSWSVTLKNLLRDGSLIDTPKSIFTNKKFNMKGMQSCSVQRNREKSRVC